MPKPARFLSFPALAGLVIAAAMTSACRDEAPGSAKADAGRAELEWTEDRGGLRVRLGALAGPATLGIATGDAAPATVAVAAALAPALEGIPGLRDVGPIGEPSKYPVADLVLVVDGRGLEFRSFPQRGELAGTLRLRLADPFSLAGADDFPADRIPRVGLDRRLSARVAASVSGPVGSARRDELLASVVRELAPRLRELAGEVATTADLDEAVDLYRDVVAMPPSALLTRPGILRLESGFDPVGAAQEVYRLDFPAAPRAAALDLRAELQKAGFSTPRNESSDAGVRLTMTRDRETIRLALDATGPEGSRGYLLRRLRAAPEAEDARRDALAAGEAPLPVVMAMRAWIGPDRRAALRTTLAGWRDRRLLDADAALTLAELWRVAGETEEARRTLRVASALAWVTDRKAELLPRATPLALTLAMPEPFVFGDPAGLEDLELAGFAMSDGTEPITLRVPPGQAATLGFHLAARGLTGALVVHPRADGAAAWTLFSNQGSYVATAVASGRVAGDAESETSVAAFTVTVSAPDPTTGERTCSVDP
ncbi:MAG: hypothetical protein R3F20_01755 [Planctomycetota bacterium]